MQPTLYYSLKVTLDRSIVYEDVMVKCLADVASYSCTGRNVKLKKEKHTITAAQTLLTGCKLLILSILIFISHTQASRTLVSDDLIRQSRQ